MKIAAIDIGSNAIRFQVTSILEYQSKYEFKKIEYVRFPLRLGHDVFSTGEISPESAEKFKKLMHAFKLLLDLYEVDDYMACATSAMRESSNGVELVKEVKSELGIEINIIDGNMEASLLNKAIYAFIDESAYIHIDVGGGSTELNLLIKRKKLFSKSFQLGSVRSLEHQDSPLVWEHMEEWVKGHINNEFNAITAVGTGGNINKIFELADIIPGNKLSLSKIYEIQKQLKELNQEERVHMLKLNPDRADVIIPASEIYASVMNWSGCKDILVPNVGLKDGILISLWNKIRGQKNPEI